VKRSSLSIHIYLYIYTCNTRTHARDSIYLALFKWYVIS